MIRVGIIGSENSHAAAFTQLFNQSGRYENIRVVGLWGEDRESNLAQCEKFGVSCMTPEEMLGRVDAVMVTSRRGDLHLPYVRPFVEKGMPVFVDKPFTMSVETAEELKTLIEKSGSPCVGGSSIRMVADALAMRDLAGQGAVGGFVYAPVNLKNEYGDFWFYASHLCEIALTIFGYTPRSVQAAFSKTGVSAILRYEDFSVSLGFVEGGREYGAAVITPEGVTYRNFDITHAYDTECEEFAHMVESGKTPQRLEELVAPVYLIDAILRSAKSGKEEKVYVE